MLQAKHLRQPIDDGSEIVKRVPEESVFWRHREAESRKIRRHHAIVLREARNQVSEHMGGCRKAVEQQHGRRAAVASLSVKDFVSSGLCSAIPNHGATLPSRSEEHTSE